MTLIALLILIFNKSIKSNPSFSATSTFKMSSHREDCYLPFFGESRYISSVFPVHCYCSLIHLADSVVMTPRAGQVWLDFQQITGIRIIVKYAISVLMFSTSTLTLINVCFTAKYKLVNAIDKTPFSAMVTPIFMKMKNNMKFIWAYSYIYILW